MEASMPPIEATAASVAASGVPPAQIRDRSAYGTCMIPRTVSLLCLRSVNRSHSLCRERSLAGNATVRASPA